MELNSIPILINILNTLAIYQPIYMKMMKKKSFIFIFHAYTFPNA